MKNIILQHYTGELGELEKLSQKNIQEYAKACGAEYRLIRGNVFHPKLTHPCQKMHMLDAKWDEYDIVVMIDIDMFMRKGMTTNIFTDVSGIGMYTEFHQNLHKGLKRNFPHLIDVKYGYWGGAIWRLEKEWRIKLRNLMNMDEMVKFNGGYDRRWRPTDTGFEDEGMMARLATLAKIPNDAQVLPGNFRWCHCSYREGIENAEMIHIRPKATPVGPIRSKIENYREMVKRGLIEE